MLFDRKRRGKTEEIAAWVNTKKIIIININSKYYSNLSSWYKKILAIYLSGNIHHYRGISYVFVVGFLLSIYEIMCHKGFYFNICCNSKIKFNF